MVKARKPLDSDKISGAEAPDPVCIHHWAIEPPNGGISLGCCKLCGVTQEFKNSYEYSSWHGMKSPNHSQNTPDEGNKS
jgi:hypothetical protein